MLKLKYLFNNKDLAEMLLKNWEYDECSLEMLDDYMISSNAINPFKTNGKVRFLRFAAVEEKNRNNLIGELEFISYLRSKGYPALCQIATKDKQELVEVDTPWGKYFAVAFERVLGCEIEETDYNDNICRKHGKYLGRLHKLSSEYKPKIVCPWSYEDVLIWIEKVLIDSKNQEKAIQEVGILREYFSKMPKNDKIFGLIHYDFEVDNVFYDQDTDALSVIDFEDAMYHWYVMDIMQALDSVKNDIETENYSELKDIFIEAYREEFEISEEMLSCMHIFRRFAGLYSYTRVLLSTSEIWKNEPEWMIELRDKLSLNMEEDSKLFGEEII